MTAKRTVGVAFVLATFVTGGAALVEAAGDDSIPYGSVSNTAWDALKASGWHGCAEDKEERLYPSYYQCQATNNVVEW